MAFVELIRVITLLDVIVFSIGTTVIERQWYFLQHSVNSGFRALAVILSCNRRGLYLHLTCTLMYFGTSDNFSVEIVRMKEYTSLRLILSWVSQSAGTLLVVTARIHKNYVWYLKMGLLYRVENIILVLQHIRTSVSQSSVDLSLWHIDYRDISFCRCCNQRALNGSDWRLNLKTKLVRSDFTDPRVKFSQNLYGKLGQHYTSRRGW